MATNEGNPLHPQPKPAPTRWLGILRQLGPGLIISASIVGSGELIVTPKLGADVGFTLLWFIIFGCFIKVFVQIQLGRYAIESGLTTLEAMNSIPGPRLVVSWLIWLWLLMYVAMVFQVAGMVGGVATILNLAGLPLSERMATLLVGLVTATLLVLGRYRLVERLSMALVAIFTLCTLGALVTLQTTNFAVTPSQIQAGLALRLPGDFTTAFAAFGIIGVGASELIYYPYWCLEKGYALNVGPNDGSPAWITRARGWMRVMHFDAWVSFLIYTSATLAFYLLGAAVLHAKGLQVEDENMIVRLSHMYQETFGPWGFWLFLVGALVVLYSTVFCSTASNARLFADMLSLYRLVHYRDSEHRVGFIKLGCVLLPLSCMAVYLIWGQPVTLVLVGALAQGLMLPFLGGATLYFYYRRTHPALLLGKLWVVGLWFAATAMAAVGAYQVVDVMQW